ncbi:transcriptional repressor NrdR [bacterium]|nr:transcriptional repressor NrdR [bacterium]
MFCPYCQMKDSRVLESRVTGEKAVRRRRECESCGKRFTTYERVEVMQILVMKRSGGREPYSREKLRAGISRACAKTNVTAEEIDDLVDSVENEMATLGKREIPASTVGELALKLLSKLDEVAYVRFASVYRQFQSMEDFVSELRRLKNELTV